MPVSSEDSVAGPFFPNGSTSAFAFDFKAASAGEVFAVDAAGNRIAPALYSVALNEGEGGTLSFFSSPLPGDYPEIYVVSEPELTQPSDFDNTGPSYNPAALTRALDRAAVRDLRQQREIDRGLKVPFGEAAPTVPSLVGQDGKALAVMGGQLTLVGFDAAAAEYAAQSAAEAEAAKLAAQLAAVEAAAFASGSVPSRPLMEMLAARAGVLLESVYVEKRRTDYLEYSVYTPLTADLKEWHCWNYAVRFNDGQLAAPALICCTKALLYASTSVPLPTGNQSSGTTAQAHQY